MPADLIFDLPADLATVNEAVDAVMRRCASCETGSRRLRLNLRVGLTEALTNAVLYGNAGDPSKRIKVEVMVDESAITAKVTDEGNGFDPHTLPDPTVPPHLTSPTGRGIFLMRQLLDEVRFNDRGNSVTMVLRLVPPSPQIGVDGGALA
jgi:serine/threonine-protein kinase RsbW